ncbi:MAG TPA: DUF4349 domain-containing protein [Methanosarcinaceae archaeon]|nr:DUF4349 domain-containing protein [Methanosarcinaceae archaeon]
MAFDQAMERADMKRMYGVFVFILIVFAILAPGCLSLETGGQAQYANDNVEYGAALKSQAYSLEDTGGIVSDSSDEIVEESISRKVITTADLSLDVDDASIAVDMVINITQDAGGFVSSSSVYNNYYGEGTGKAGYVTIRIPQSGFTPVMDEIGMLGSVTSKSISGRDVTEEYTDLSARLGNLERQELRLLEILNMTTTVDEVLDVERELGRIRGEIESLTGRLNYLNDQVDLSTINVRVSEPRPITHSWGLRNAILDSVNGFISTVNGLIVFIGYVLPILIFVTVSGGVIIFIRNRVRK